MPPKKPTSVSILAYQVGFGDCFLVRFQYQGARRHMLVDFGAFPPPRWAETGYRRQVADSIAHECGGKLEVVVVTHRHADHINGFETKPDGSGPGNVIAGLNPDLIIQPWTEDPDARRNANKPTASFLDALALDGDEPKRLALENGRAYVGALEDMQSVADMVFRSAEALSGMLPSDLVRQLSFYGENGISNRSAVQNLIDMGNRQGAEAKYVYHGFNLDLKTVLPGVTARVLGPPTLEQTKTIRKYAKKDPEYWSLRTRFWQLQAKAARRTIESVPLFPELSDELRQGETLPAHVRWLVHRLTTVRGRELLEIVRTLDTWLNNTSVILLFEVGGKKLLFPGDAQIENWRYALDPVRRDPALADVDLYKVGHHGSLNATPRSLWNGFTRKSPNGNDANRLTTVVSTMKDEHGHEESNTEVPRRTLVNALKAESKFWTTQNLTEEKVDFETIRLNL
jgi:hypothetical protein